MGRHRRERGVAGRFALTRPSGFEEEYERALNRHRETGAPSMWIFLLDVDRSDPGEELASGFGVAPVVLAAMAAADAGGARDLDDFDALQAQRAVSPAP